jgi:hypothetical protein
MLLSVTESVSDHYLGPNNVGNIARAEEAKLAITLYSGEKKGFPGRRMFKFILSIMHY